MSPTARLLAALSILASSIASAAPLNMPLTPGETYVFDQVQTVRVVRLTADPNWVVVASPEQRDTKEEVLVNLSQVQTITAAGQAAAVSKAGMSEDQAIMENLMKLDGSKQQWALEYNKQATDEPTWEEIIGPNDYIRKMITDPKGGTYLIQSVGENPVLVRDGGKTIITFGTDMVLEKRTLDIQAKPIAPGEKGIAEALAKMDGATQQWALENGKTSTDKPSWEQIAGETLYLRYLPIDPEGGVFELRQLKDAPRLYRPSTMTVYTLKKDGSGLEKSSYAPVK